MAKFFTFVAAALLATAPAQADTVLNIQGLQASVMAEAAMAGLGNWKVGDKASYKVSIGGFINGTSQNSVREITPTSIWMVQEMDLGFMGKQKSEILFNKATGQIEKVLVNGQEQQVPDVSEVELVETKEDHIRVAAGEFDCIYAKIKNKKDGSFQEAWINPQAVPMGGNLKVLADTQFGKLTQELTAFEFGK